MTTKDWLGESRRKRPAMGTQTFASFSGEKVDLIQVNSLTQRICVPIDNI